MASKRIRIPFVLKKPVELKPWEAPNYATTDEATDESVSVKDLDDATLAHMASLWLDDLYEKAGKARPPTVAP